MGSYFGFKDSKILYKNWIHFKIKISMDIKRDQVIGNKNNQWQPTTK